MFYYSKAKKHSSNAVPAVLVDMKFFSEIRTCRYGLVLVLVNFFVGNSYVPLLTTIDTYNCGYC